MKQSELKVWEVCDYIRLRHRAGAKRIVWGKHDGLLSFWKFVLASFPTELGYKLPDTPHGLTFMGLKHYVRASKINTKKQ